MMAGDRLLSRPYARQRLVHEHLDALEALAIREHGGRFTTRGRTAPDVSVQRSAHLRCLRFRQDEAEHEALVRLQSRAFSSVASAAHVLAVLSGERAIDARGAVLLAGPREHAITEGIARSGMLRHVMIGDDRSVEALSKTDDVPEGVLMGHLLSPSPRSGLLAAARARRLPEWAVGQLVALAIDREPSRADHTSRCRPIALYALGVWAARLEGRPDASVASLIDAALGDSLCDETAAEPPLGLGANAALLGMAVVGHVATARRVVRCIERSGPTQDRLFSLGLLGVPACAGPLVSELRSPDAMLRAEALRGLYLMTGKMFVMGGEGSMRDDGSGLVPDEMAAEAFLTGWRYRHDNARFHLGWRLDVDAPEAPPSFQLLRAIFTGLPRSLGAESLPGLFDGRSRTRTVPFTVAPPAPALFNPAARAARAGAPSTADSLRDGGAP